jgi:pantetheine-phosphate adenylyltransferase
MRIGIYAGCFDPLTFGHLWVIEEGLRLFDRLYVMIGKNPVKTSTFTEEDRITMLNESLKDKDSFSYVSSGKVIVGILPDNVVVQARKIADLYKGYDGVEVYVLRGIRDPHDFKYEETICQTIRRVDDNLHHVFVVPPEGHIGTSSTAVKEQWVRYGWEMTSHLVPEPVIKMMKAYQGQHLAGYSCLCAQYPNTSIFEQTTAGFASPPPRELCMWSSSGHEMELTDQKSIYGGTSPSKYRYQFLDADDLFGTMVLTCGKIRNFHDKCLENGFMSYADKVSANQVQAMLDFCNVEVISSETFHLKTIQIDSVTPTGTRFLPCSHSLGPIIVDLKTADLAAIDSNKILGDVVIIEGKHRWLDAKDRGETTIQAWVGEKAFEKLGFTNDNTI